MKRIDIDRSVRGVLDGDHDRYRVVVAACEAPVRAAVTIILTDAVAANDVVPEVFVTAFLRLREYKTGTDVVAWMTAIARSVARRERRLRSLRSRRLPAKRYRPRAVVSESLADGTGRHWMVAPGEWVDALETAVRELAGARNLRRTLARHLVAERLLRRARPTMSTVAQVMAALPRAPGETVTRVMRNLPR